jgi:signal transduction histidine kinase
LTQQAKEMAERRLPDAVIDILETPLGDDVTVPRVEPVQVHTRDEVADVADALNIVQDTALDLAVEQAVLRRNIADSFVNLGRRNQNLLGRQLDFITELETNETDPDTLANLFRLDHLATRMRRNAESLLVLAGIEPPRKWAAPVRLTDVIRAALGEVEDYQRVTVRGVEPTTILGSAAADLAHLLAELIENALVFSPPDQTVDIRGRNRPDSYRSRPASTDSTARDLYEPGYTLAIIDSGLGMPHGDVTAANRRLAGAESFTIAPSKYLGHYVAGNLAARHNITVHLDNSPGNGITATIDLPPTLLTTDEAPPGFYDEGFRGIGMGAGAGPALHALPDGAMVAGGWDDDAGQDSYGPYPPVAPVAAPDPVPPPPMPVGRTPSGLVKRSPTNGNGNGNGHGHGHGHGAQTTIGADEPSGELLDRLSRHSANLSPEGRGLPRTGLWGPLEPLGPPSGPATGRTPIDVGPALPGGPGMAPGDPGAPAPAAFASPPDAPRDESWMLRTSPPPAGPAAPERGPFDPWPPTPLPEAGEPPAAWPPPGDWPPVVRTPSDDSPVAFPRAAPPASPIAPIAPIAPAPAVPPAAGDATTAGGLTRRVRGAQMPSTEPLRMRRSPDDDALAPAPGAGRVAPERTPEQRRAADDVYNFLTSFSAGVQRGLDEAAQSQGG